MTVSVTGWKRGLKKIGLNRLLRLHAGLGLAEAKRCVDSLLDGHAFECEFGDMESAAAFCRAASAIGAICSFENGAR